MIEFADWFGDRLILDYSYEKKVIALRFGRHTKSVEFSKQDAIKLRDHLNTCIEELDPEGDEMFGITKWEDA